MLSTLSTVDALAKSDGATSFRTGETMQVWSTSFAELDPEKKQVVQVMGYSAHHHQRQLKG
jgi:hypothetical protein